MDRLLATWSGQVAAAGRSRSPQPTTHRKSSGQKRHQYCRNGRNRQDEQAGGDQWSDPVVDPQYRKLCEDNNNTGQPAALPQKISANCRQNDGYRIPYLPVPTAVPRFVDPGPFANKLPIQSTDHQQGEHYSNATAHHRMISYSRTDSNVASTALAIANQTRSFAFPTAARPANVMPGRFPVALIDPAAPPHRTSPTSVNLVNFGRFTPRTPAPPAGSPRCATAPPAPRPARSPPPPCARPAGSA